jgi:hypothetical protein
VTTATEHTDRRRYLNRKQRELNNLRGIPNRVDASEARAHILSLRRTMGWTRIAAATGCSACHLRYIVDGRTTVINRVTHERILATPPAPEVTGGLYIDATGTRRRVQALMAQGHPQYAIAIAANTTQHRISVISLGAARVRQKVADKIAEAYEQLAGLEGTSARARTLATQNQWPDSAYWHDVDRIDDPDFDPDTTLTRIAQVAEDSRWLLAAGLDRNTVAERLGISRDYVDKALREVPETSKAAA